MGAHCKHFRRSHLHSQYAHCKPLVSKYLRLAIVCYPISGVLNLFFRPSTPEGYDMLPLGRCGRTSLGPLGIAIIAPLTLSRDPIASPSAGLLLLLASTAYPGNWDPQ
jgi:hypothetical protein